MEPRRTFRETSRTAKNPANSLVNPWVSRMNSSAKQASPISHRREVRIARGRLSFHRLVLPDVLERHGPAASGGGICRHPSRLGKAERRAVGPFAAQAGASAIS